MKRNFEFVLDVDGQDVSLVETEELMFEMLCNKFNDDFETLINNWDNFMAHGLDNGKYKVIADGGLTKSGSPVVYIVSYEKIKEGQYA